MTLSSSLSSSLLSSMTTNNAYIESKDNKSWSAKDIQYMQQALNLASEGALKGEVPVGAVLVCNDKIIGLGFNQPICASDPTAHAEIIALRQACRHLENYRLTAGTTLYVTLEPCTMCIGALIHARLSKLVFATFEPRAGMVGSQMNLAEKPFYNHNLEVGSGLLKDQSQQLLKDFFKQRRAFNKQLKQQQQ